MSQSKVPVGEKVNLYRKGEDENSVPFGKTLLSLLALAGGIAFSFSGNDSVTDNSKNQGTLETRVEQHGERLDPGESLDTENLQGHRLNGLYAEYTGTQGTVPENVENSFEDQLMEMWERKKKISSNKEAIQHVIDEQVKTYDNEESLKMDTESYLDYSDDIIADLKTSLDKEGLYDRFSLEKEERTFMNQFISETDSDDLMPYFMTELYPSYDGTMNEEVTDFILENAGLEFFNLLPASGDGYASFGPGQLTSWVVRNDGVLGDANLFAKYTDEDLPGSMKNVEGKDHVTANFGNTIVNTIRTVKKMNEDEVKTLKSKLHGKKQAEFIAGHHHRPDTYRNHLILDQDMDISETDLTGIDAYLEKTRNNYEALHNPEELRPKTLDQYFTKKTSTKEFEIFKVESDIKDPEKVSDLFDRVDTKDVYDETGSLNAIEPMRGDSIELYDGDGEMWFRARKNDAKPLNN